MKKHNFIFCLLVLVTLPHISLFGQSQFQKIYSEENCIEFQIESSMNGDIYVVSNSYNDTAYYTNKIFIQRLNVKGEPLYAKGLHKLGGKSYSLQSIYATSDDGILVSGTFKNYSTDNDSVFVIKLDKNGDVIWNKMFQFDSDYHILSGIKETTDGGYIIYGVFFYSGINTSAIFLTKLDVSGNKVWTREVGSEISGTFLHVGGIVEESNGDFYLSGSTRLNSEGSWVAKFNRKGELSTVNFYDTHKLTDSQPEPFAMFRRSNGDRDIFYYHTSYKDGSLLIQLRTDIAGKPLNTNIYSFNHIYGGNITHIRPHGSDGYIISGYQYPNANYRPDGIAFELDAQNNIKWSKSYGTNYIEYLSGIVSASDGGFFLGGFADFDSTIVSPGENGLLGWIVKTDANGNSNCFTNNLNLSSKTVSTASKAYSLKDKARDDIQNGTWMELDLNLILDSVSCEPAGLKSFNEYRLIIYPNPTKDKVNIESNGLMGKIQLFDDMGRLILVREIQNSSLEELELPETKGVYLLMFISEKGRYLHKVIKN